MRAADEIFKARENKQLREISIRRRRFSSLEERFLQ
jgi:hypothetical protein